MAKAEKDVFSVYESVEATPFGVAFICQNRKYKRLYTAQS